MSESGIPKQPNDKQRDEIAEALAPMLEEKECEGKGHLWDLMGENDKGEPDLFYQCDFCDAVRGRDFIKELEAELEKYKSKYENLDADMNSLAHKCGHFEGQLEKYKETEARRITELEEATITSHMKAECMGEFTAEYDRPIWDEDGECFLEDELERAYLPISWDTMKDIYKMMHKVRVLEKMNDE